MKKTLLAVVIGLAFSTMAFAGDASTQVVKGDQPQVTSAADHDIRLHTNVLVLTNQMTALTAVGVAMSPLFVLAAPHHGIEMVTGYADKIENPVGHVASKIALAPFRVVAAVLSGPSYLVSGVFGVGHEFAAQVASTASFCGI